MRAVFLHTGWRSGGTWVWSQLRALAGVAGYYEPLHELLATIDESLIDITTAGSWDSRHDETVPYFAEYTPLLQPRSFGRARGVSGYQARFAYERFFLEPDAEAAALEQYLQSLLDAAAGAGRLPVLKFCRSMGRVGWMQRRFPDALHAVVLRDPVAQWASSVAQLAADNRFFVVAPLLVLARNRGSIAVQEAVDWFGVRLPVLPQRRRGLDAELCWRHFRRLDAADRYRGFLAFWTLTAIAALQPVGALIIDADRLVVDAAHRSAVQERFCQYAARLDVGFVSAVRPRDHALPEGGEAAHAAALGLLTARKMTLSEAAFVLIEGKLNDRGVERVVQHGLGPVEEDAAGAAATIRRAAYFAAMEASMPLRRLHGRLHRLLSKH